MKNPKSRFSTVVLILGAVLVLPVAYWIDAPTKVVSVTSGLVVKDDIFLGKYKNRRILHVEVEGGETVSADASVTVGVEHPRLVGKEVEVSEWESWLLKRTSYTVRVRVPAGSNHSYMDSSHK